MRNLWGISKLARREHYKLRGNNASPWAFEFYINNIKRKTKSYFFFTCSMERILERYQQYSYAERALLEADTEVQVAYHQRPASKPQCFIQITKSMWMLYIGKLVPWIWATEGKDWGTTNESKVQRYVLQIWCFSCTKMFFLLYGKFHRDVTCTVFLCHFQAPRWWATRKVDT